MASFHLIKPYKHIKYGMICWMGGCGGGERKLDRPMEISLDKMLEEEESCFHEHISYPELLHLCPAMATSSEKDTLIAIKFWRDFDSICTFWNKVREECYHKEFRSFDENKQGRRWHHCQAESLYMRHEEEEEEEELGQLDRHTLECPFTNLTSLLVVSISGQTPTCPCC